MQPDYQESEVRKDFIDKFFIALGWDVNHEEQKNPYAQEVKVERNVQTAYARRKADYAFSLAPNYEEVQFFVEAKKPSRKLKNADDYFQTIRYGWNAGTPVAALTDFEEFHIIDCRFAPDVDTALDRQVESFHYTEFLDEESFARVYYIFSREAVADGLLEDYTDRKLPEPEGPAIQRGLFKGGYRTIDESFLDDLSRMRLQLARAFKGENPSLSDSELTEATQRTIDRLVFMRFLEDRLIEPDPLISELGTRGTMWEDFRSTCKRLDAKYNGIVFREHFTDQQDFGGVASEHFRSIVEELSHHNSPYDFSALPIHVLGAIYERFLGSTVVADDKRVQIEEKPLTRKAGGVYYTPQYIVRRIVEETVGKAIEGKKPKGVLKLRFADIACGSGSFLITVFDRLLEHCGAWYQEHPEQAEKDGCHNIEGRWTLSLRQKREILTSCIYGVDVDFQAVEVAQLSLYLKLLEDETTATANEMQVLFAEQILPDLSGNVVGGNSLISFDAIQGDFFQDSASAMERVNPMDFSIAFPEVMSEGGFHAIVGNPPYVRIQTLRETSEGDVDLYNERYSAAGVGNYDIYVLFVERGLDLLRPDGRLGYILPHKFFNAKYGRPLRNLLADGQHLEGIVHFTDQQIFRDATTYTCLLFLSKEDQDSFSYTEVDNLQAWVETGESRHSTLPADAADAENWNFIAGDARPVLKKLQSLNKTVGDVTVRISQGIRTSAQNVYVLDLTSPPDQDVITAKSASLKREVKLEREATQLFLKGEEIKPFQVLPSGKVVITPYEISEEGRPNLIPEQEMKERFPLTWEYLTHNKEQLESRERGRFRGEDWYQYGRSQNIDLALLPKILVPDTADRASFALDEHGSYAFTSGYGITLKEDTELNLRALLGLLNSDVLNFYVQRVSTPLRGGFFRYFTQYIEQLPLPDLGSDEKSVVKRLSDLVDGIHSAINTLSEVRTDRQKNVYRHQLQSKKNELNRMVYDLYGLDETEQQAISDELER